MDDLTSALSEKPANLSTWRRGKTHQEVLSIIALLPATAQLDLTNAMIKTAP